MGSGAAQDVSAVRFNLELQAAATDNGIVISLTDQHAFPLDAVFEFVKSASVEQTLTQALLPAPMFAARWRWNATRALAILRFQRRAQSAAATDAHARRRSAGGGLPRSSGLPGESDRADSHSRSRAGARDDRELFARGDGSRRLASRFCATIEAGAMRTVAIDTPEPSVFCHEILNANPFAYLDDAPLEERRARAVQLRRTMRDDVDGAGISRSRGDRARSPQESWPVVRDADELHDALATLIVMPPVAAWKAWFEELVAQRRATHAGDGAFGSAPSGSSSRAPPTTTRPTG